MMRSLSSAVGGLRSHQTKMDVIGNNIANVNTYGFKSSRASFSDVYYQTLSKGSTPATALGGTNPTQIGYGAVVATIDVMNSVSGPTSTDRAMDIYISGDGMIATKDANGNLQYSRLGILGFDAAGNLVDGNGNFVQGFPIDKDGNPQIRPDGTVDIQDLARITAEPEMLDQLTGISIGPTGEIIGTMPGDTSITLNNKRPDWLIDVETVDESSNVLGDIKVVMEFISASESDMPADWITGITAEPNSKISGTYDFSYEDGIIKAVGPGNVTYTGAYKNGSSIRLTNAKGETAFTVDTHRYTQPTDNGRLGSMQFTTEQQITVEFADKGGNKYSYTVPYDGVQTEITIDQDPEKKIGVKLTLDPTAVAMIDVMSMEYKTTNEFATGGKLPDGVTDYVGWLESVFLDKDATYDTDSFTLAAGVKQTVTSNIGVIDSLQFLDKDAVDSLVRALNQTGKYTFLTTEESGGTKVELELPDGTKLPANALITGVGDKITFTVGTETFEIGTIKAEHYKITDFSSSVKNFYEDNGLSKSAIESYLQAKNYTGPFSIGYAQNTPAGGDYTFTLYGGADGTTVLGSAVVVNGAADKSITLSDGGTVTQLIGNLADIDTAGWNGDKKDLGTRSTNFSFKGATLATLSERNTIQLIDSKGTVLEEAIYNGSDKVTLGKMTLQVNKDNLNAYFKARPVIDDYMVEISDSVTNAPEPDWAFDGNGAFAQAGVGESMLIGNIAIAKIPNVAGMVQSGDSYFVTSPNSGAATFQKPGINETGTLKAGYLEMSNVDISKEFTEMITTQRGFQANTRIVTVSDEMLNELVNLKR